jgi:hypothetical protein
MEPSREATKPKGGLVAPWAAIIPLPGTLVKRPVPKQRRILPGRKPIYRIKRPRAAEAGVFTLPPGAAGESPVSRRSASVRLSGDQ